MQTLDELKLNDNTLVMFLNDNGASPNDRVRRGEFGTAGTTWNTAVAWANVSNTPMKFYKRTQHSGGVSTPFIARWPAAIKPQAEFSDQPLHVTDMLPTMMDVAGIEYPRSFGGRVSEHVGYFPDALPTIAQAAGGSLPTDIDGISFLPELIGETAAGGKQQQHDYLYWEHGKWVAIRQGDWRAVDPGIKDWELYNLKSDPAESKNLAADHPEILNKLRALAKQANEPMLEGTYSTRERADSDGSNRCEATGAMHLVISHLVISLGYLNRFNQSVLKRLRAD